MSIFSVADAQAAIQAQVPLLPSDRLGLRELNGCVLAEPIVMERDQPPFDRVTMDGIALSAHVGNNTRRLRIAGTQAAGATPLSLQQATDCIEVMTGAELPPGCDCVIPVERLQIAEGYAQLNEDVQPSAWLNVHRRGSDAHAGSTLLQPGQRLSATEVAVIASAGHAQALVRRSPRIALVSTGNELIEPGEPIQSWQVRRSNTYALQAALQQHGHARIVDAHLVDDPDILRSRLQTLLDENDVLVLSGGVSMGKFDFVPQVLSELGVQCVFHKIAQRPGKPMWFGVRSDGKTVYALPGNPVSTLICLQRYVLPGLAKSMGASLPECEHISLAGAVKAHDELSVFLPVTLHCDTAGITHAIPCPTRGSGDFISLLGTAGFVELPPAQGMIPAGSVVSLFRW
ncbi:MAG: molybdopterin molybdotransferase MoeA [Steroidobacteraceae bacterium]